MEYVLEREISANVPSSGEKELLLNTKKTFLGKKNHNEKTRPNRRAKKILYIQYMMLHLDVDVKRYEIELGS